MATNEQRIANATRITTIMTITLETFKELKEAPGISDLDRQILEAKEEEILMALEGTRVVLMPPSVAKKQPTTVLVVDRRSRAKVFHTEVPEEKRVRIDVNDDLDNYAVLCPKTGNELTNWMVDWS